MEAIRVLTTIERDGEVLMTGLPFKKGERVELIFKSDAPIGRVRKPLRARDLRNSPLIGIWKGRIEIGDSPEFARALREKAQRRQSES